MTEPFVLPDLGTFVNVDGSLGVVIGWPDDSDIPEQHVAVWFGQAIDDERVEPGGHLPRCRTVPAEQCQPVLGLHFD